jgi:hypothetical protein
MALLSEQAAPRVKRKRPVVFREVPVADLPPRLAARDFPSLALRLKSVSVCRLVSAKQMALRTARGRPWEQRKLALPVWQSDQQVLVFSLPTPQLLAPSPAQLESAPRPCSCRSSRTSQVLWRLPRVPS